MCNAMYIVKCAVCYVTARLCCIHSHMCSAVFTVRNVVCCVLYAVCCRACLHNAQCRDSRHNDLCNAHVLSVCKQPLALADNAADLQPETSEEGQEVWNVLSVPSTAADFAEYQHLVFLCCHGHILFHLICTATCLSTDT